MRHRLRLVTIPSADAGFGDRAREVLEHIPSGLPLSAVLEQLHRELQEEYPGAVVRPRDDLADVGITDEIVWYVTNRAYRSRISTALTVPAPRDFVFRIYVERVAEWQTAIKLQEQRLTPNLVGSEWTATWGFLGRTSKGVLRLVEADPPHSVRFEASGMGIRVWYDTSFTPEGTGTVVRVVGDYDVPEGVVPRIVDRLFMERGIQRQIDNAHAALLALCVRAIAQPAAS